MRRRQFVLLLGGAALWPFAAGAQQAARVYRVGFLWHSPGVFPDAIEAFRHGLRDLGWIDGRNVLIENRWSQGDVERLHALAAELVRLNVDVIVAPTSIYAGAAIRATSVIPVVFVSHADPIGSGHVASLKRPGGNATGLSLMMTETNAKLLELLKEAIPRLSRVAVIWDPATPSHKPGLAAVEVASRTLELQLQSVPVGSPTEFAGAFANIAREGADGVLVLSTPLFIAGGKQLAEFAIARRLPTIFGPRSNAEDGGLMSFGPDRADLFRRGAIYVDKILKGASPADLPVQQPTKFELVVNLKTAKMLGLEIPESFLLRADHVIQ